MKLEREYDGGFTDSVEAVGLSEDETAVATLMIKTALYNRDEAPAPYSVEDAIADAYAAILLKEAVKTGKCIRSDMKRIKE